MASKIQIKRGNKADLPILSDGEYGFCQDTSEIFIGNGGTNTKIYPTTSLDASSVTVEDIESMFESVNVEGVLSELGESILDILNGVTTVGKASDANTVGGFTVAKNVPSNANFTDTVTTINGKTGEISKADIVALGIPSTDTNTTYTEITTTEIDTGTASTLRTITGRRVKYILDKVQGWIGGLTKSDVGLSNVDNVKQATKTEFDAHKADNVQYLNVKSFGAQGNGLVDDTQAVKQTFIQAANEKKGVRFPSGTYLIMEPLTINDNGVTQVTGDGQDKTKLLFDNPTGYAMTVKTYYTRPVTLSQLSIVSKTKSVEKNGLDVNSGAWGVGVNIEGVNIIGFGGVSLKLVEAFNSSFRNMVLNGYASGDIRTGTLLKIDKISNFGSNNTFTNSVFHIAKIGVQNFAGSAYDFNGCTFENLDLFLNVKQLPGLSMFMSFKSCWLELVDRGVINAEINESTLLPLSPVTGKAPIDRLIFQGNATSTITWTTFLNQTVNPFEVKHFSFTSGLVLGDAVGVRKLSFNDTFPSTINFTKVYSMMELNYNPNNAFRVGSYTIHVKVMDSTGKTMRASFISDNYHIHLLGSVHDPDNIGVGDKISPSWFGDVTQLTMRVYGVDLTSCSFTVLYSET